MMIKKMMATLAAITLLSLAACATPQRIELASVPASTSNCRLNGNTFKMQPWVRAYESTVLEAQTRCQTLGISDLKKLDGHYRKIQKYLDKNGCTWEQVPLTHVENLSDLCPGDDWKFAGKSFEFGKSEIKELEDPMASREATPDDESDRTAVMGHARESADTRQAVEAVDAPQVEPKFVQAQNGKMPSELDLTKAVIAMVGVCPGKKVVCQGIASAGVELPKGKVSNKDLSDRRLNMCLTAVRNQGGDAIATNNPDYAGNEAVRGVYLSCYSGSKDELFARIPEIMRQADAAKQMAKDQSEAMKRLNEQLAEARKAAEAARKAAAEAKEGLTTKAEKSEISEYVIPPLEKCCQLDAGGFALANTAYASGGAHLGLVIPVGNVLRAQIGGYFGAVTGVGSLGVGGEIEVRYPLVKVDSAVIMLVPKLLYFTDSNDKIKAVRTDYGAGIGVRMEIFSFYLSLDAVGVTYGDQDHNLPGKIDDFPLMGIFRAGFIYPKSDK